LNRFSNIIDQQLDMEQMHLLWYKKTSFSHSRINQSMFMSASGSAQVARVSKA
jgi:hypothetical protein